MLTYDGIVDVLHDHGVAFTHQIALALLELARDDIPARAAWTGVQPTQATVVLKGEETVPTRRRARRAQERHLRERPAIDYTEAT